MMLMTHFCHSYLATSVANVIIGICRSDRIGTTAHGDRASTVLVRGKYKRGIP